MWINNSSIVKEKVENSFTKDAAFINQWSHHPVFVYGTIKKGYYNDWAIEDAKYLGTGVTRLDFILLDYNFNFPIAALKNSMPTPKEAKGKIEGEVYLVPSKNLIGMDCLEANGYMYDRHKTHILFTDVVEEFKRFTQIKTFMYIGTGDWFKNPNSKPILCDEKGILKWSRKK